jgi:excisionase family DNA binding protein
MRAGFARDELLEVAQVAHHLRVNNVTVYRWCREGCLPCLKLGNTWRVRRSALDNFLVQGEHSTTLMAQLRSFYRVPDNVLAVAQTPEMPYRLDAAFLKVGETRGGRLTKFYIPRSGAPRDQLRAELEAVELDI